MDKNPKKHRQVVIKDSKKGSIQFFAGVIAFIAAGIFLLHLDSTFTMVVGIVSLVFFGTCGIIGLVTIRQPKAVISDEGILIPHLFRKDFVHWENVDKFAIIEQQIPAHGLKYIGIFTVDPNTVGNYKKDKWMHVLLMRNELPTWMIEFAYSPEQIEEVMGVLEEFHNEYKSNRLVNKKKQAQQTK